MTRERLAIAWAALRHGLPPQRARLSLLCLNWRFSQAAHALPMRPRWKLNLWPDGHSENLHRGEPDDQSMHYCDLRSASLACRSPREPDTDCLEVCKLCPQISEGTNRKTISPQALPADNRQKNNSFWRLIPANRGSRKHIFTDRDFRGSLKRSAYAAHCARERLDSLLTQASDQTLIASDTADNLWSDVLSPNTSLRYTLKPIALTG